MQYAEYYRESIGLQRRRPEPRGSPSATESATATAGRNVGPRPAEDPLLTGEIRCLQPSASRQWMVGARALDEPILTSRAGLRTRVSDGPCDTHDVVHDVEQRFADPIVADGIARADAQRPAECGAVRWPRAVDFATPRQGLLDPRQPAQGEIRYALKTPYRDGTTQMVFEPEDVIARLAALVPNPRMNLTRFHGVFASHYRLRAKITARRRDRTGWGRVGDPRGHRRWAGRSA